MKKHLKYLNILFVLLMFLLDANLIAQPMEYNAKEKKIEKAGDNLLNQLAEGENHSESIHKYYETILENEKLNEAIKSFNSALMRDNKDTESYLGKSLAYWLLKDYDKVLIVISEMQSLGLRFNRMELLLADVYFKKNDYENAMKYAKQDEEENSSQAEAHYLLGVLYKMKDEKDKAELEFEEATSIMQQNPQASLELSINVFFNAEIK